MECNAPEPGAVMQGDIIMSLPDCSRRAEHSLLQFCDPHSFPVETGSLHGRQNRACTASSTLPFGEILEVTALNARQSLSASPQSGGDTLCCSFMCLILCPVETWSHHSRRNGAHKASSSLPSGENPETSEWSLGYLCTSLA